MTATMHTSEVEATVIAAVWQLEDWVAHKVAVGAATPEALQTLRDMGDLLGRNALANAPHSMLATLLDDIRVFVCDPWNDLGLDDDDDAYWSVQLAELADELR